MADKSGAETDQKQLESGIEDSRTEAKSDEQTSLVLAQIETAKMAPKDAIDGDKSEEGESKSSELTKIRDSRGEDTGMARHALTASQRRQQKISKITIENIYQRQVDSWVTFRETKILTPDHVSLLYKQREEKHSRRMNALLRQELVARRKKESKAGTMHAVWKQDPDNVYEIVQLLTEHGFKSDQTNTVWPYTEFERLLPLFVFY